MLLFATVMIPTGASDTSRHDSDANESDVTRTPTPLSLTQLRPLAHLSIPHQSTLFSSDEDLMVIYLSIYL